MAVDYLHLIFVSLSARRASYLNCWSIFSFSSCDL